MILKLQINIVAAKYPKRVINKHKKGQPMISPL